ncbi:MAG: sensor histidine kinase [Chloroflexota bacterium]
MPKELQIPQEIDLAAFISKEAHDLKSPFNRALGFIKLVLKGMDGPISEQAKQDLNIAYQNTLYTLAMMNGLVDMSRLERGERIPSPKALPVEMVLRQVVIEWKRQYPKENTVEVTFSGPDVAILADEMLVRQSFLKWASYVNEFVGEAAAVSIEYEEQPETICFTVSSSGKKVPAPECDLTMHGFIATRLLALHNGELLRVEENDDGARVCFRLPKAPNP